SLILKQKVKILKVLPLESPRLGDEQSLIVMDVVVELEDHSIANLEVQKAGYYFPGQRAACYSSDLLLRQYRRVREDLEKQEKRFSYKEIKKVYTIILYEKSPKEFHDFLGDYMHRFAQRSDTGIEIDLLQEYVFISLDNFHGILHNKGIRNQLEAWLTFLSVDEPEKIAKLIREYPQFEKYYKEIYKLCRNTERVMQMFSEELRELDRNTVQYMIDDMKDEIDAQKETIAEQGELLSQKDAKIDVQEKLLSQKDDKIDSQEKLLSQKDDRINAQNKEIEELKRRLAQFQTESM
ncbi:MAG TPA: PD-(D/E)XK nuclease family transposase, partial [Candidatus Mediterraneibacter merdavium]|nr:PD-(D/E)XK nuclease family transposase [Candidatus Mediterraneibacter merdavium]